MADVDGPEGWDRAQLILVSGLTLAVTMLILVLLLNTAIYTENVATRGIDSDVGDAAQFQQTMDEEIAAIIEHHEGEDEDLVVKNVTADFEILILQQANSSIERGHVADAEFDVETENVSGTYVVSEVEYDLTYITSDVRYETTRTVERETS